MCLRLPRLPTVRAPVEAKQVEANNQQSMQLRENVAIRTEESKAQAKEDHPSAAVYVPGAESSDQEC